MKIDILDVICPILAMGIIAVVLSVCCQCCG
jgi:hypothetical protein